jgi:hypothetical protein
MEFFSLVIVIFGLVWAYRIETNTAKTVEALRRIEEVLKQTQNNTKKGE